jgi:hypothetical protein
MGSLGSIQREPTTNIFFVGTENNKSNDTLPNYQVLTKNLMFAIVLTRRDNMWESVVTNSDICKTLSMISPEDAPVEGSEKALVIKSVRLTGYTNNISTDIRVIIKMDTTSLKKLNKDPRVTRKNGRLTPSYKNDLEKVEGGLFADEEEEKDEKNETSEEDAKVSFEFSMRADTAAEEKTSELVDLIWRHPMDKYLSYYANFDMKKLEPRSVNTIEVSNLDTIGVSSKNIVNTPSLTAFPSSSSSLSPPLPELDHAISGQSGGEEKRGDTMYQSQEGHGLQSLMSKLILNEYVTEKTTAQSPNAKNSCEEKYNRLVKYVRRDKVLKDWSVASYFSEGSQNNDSTAQDWILVDSTVCDRMRKKVLKVCKKIRHVHTDSDHVDVNIYTAKHAELSDGDYVFPFSLRVEYLHVPLRHEKGDTL